MNSVIVFVVIACLTFGSENGLSTELSNTNALIAWEAFVQTYNKQYSAEEYEIRKLNFLENYDKLCSQNIEFYDGNSTFENGITQFSDLSSDEFIQKHTGFIPLNDTSDSDFDNHLLNPGLAAPVNLDWRDQKIMTPVKHQQGCGSCWAFATIAVLEGVYNRKNGLQTTSLSEQFLVDCNTNNNNCEGGWPHTAFKFIKNNGSALRDTYPYNGTPGRCQKNKAVPLYKNITFARFNNLNDEALKQALSDYGPLAVSVDAKPLQNYKSGILDTKSCVTQNHAVTLVGYVTSGVGAPYYILRNSHGPDWGEAGHFRVSAVNDCLVKKYVVAVTSL